MGKSNSLASFYKDRRVLITGHTGFKGAWLSLWLGHLGARVYGLSIDIPSQPSLYEQVKLNSETQSHFLDINDYGKLNSLVSDIQPEFIFHLAAQSLVRKSYDQPLNTFSTNVMGTAHVLESARQVKNLKAVVIVTSDKSYQNNEAGLPFVETDPMGGDDPYSASKGASELIFHSYFKSFFNQPDSASVCSVRAGNVIGGGDWALDRIVPDAIRSWGNQKNLEIRSPQSIRPWQHVLEPLYGYLLAAKVISENKKLTGESFNFGPGEQNEKSVLDLIKTLSQYCSFASGWDLSHPAKGGKKEAQVLRLKSDKAKSQLNWRNHLDFSETLKWTGQWYSEVQEKPNQARALTLQQIKDFEIKIRS